jgi:beta-glucanase (GH16 family)
MQTVSPRTTVTRRLLAGTLVAVASTAMSVISVSDRAQAATWETLINNSFQSRAALVAEWNFNYPWGDTHNGSARMVGSATDNSHVYLPTAGQLTIKASPVSGQGSIHYLSGAIWAKDRVLVNDQFPQYELRGEFQAPSVRGTWPAFWITGATSWPPESDILEYKGDARNWFNTYKNASGGWSNTIVSVASPASWHQYQAMVAKISATDVQIQYYLDGVLRGTHRGANFVGKSMWIIINMQMEGSSGSPGPTGATYYSARNVYLARSRA